MIVPGTTPYAWPYDRGFSPQRCALVICGSGDEWARRCTFDGSVEARIDELRRAAARAHILVVLLRHRDPHDRIVVTSGHCAAGLQPRQGELVVNAAGIDGFYGSELDAVLHRRLIDQILFAGRGFETAVHSTLRRANDRGYECLTIADACASADPACRAGAISTIEMSGGIFGAVGSTAPVLATIAHSIIEELP